MHAHWVLYLRLRETETAGFAGYPPAKNYTVRAIQINLIHAYTCEFKYTRNRDPTPLLPLPQLSPL